MSDYSIPQVGPFRFSSLFTRYTYMYIHTLKKNKIKIVEWKLMKKEKYITYMCVLGVPIQHIIQLLRVFLIFTCTLVAVMYAKFLSLSYYYYFSSKRAPSFE